MTAELPNDFTGDFSDDLNKLNNKLNTLFGKIAPDAEFETRMVTGLQRARMRITKWINPHVRRAAISTAAVLALATMGYVGSNMIDPGSANFSILESGSAQVVGPSDDRYVRLSSPTAQSGETAPGETSLQFEAAESGVHRSVVSKSRQFIENKSLVDTDGDGFAEGSVQKDMHSQDSNLSITGGIIVTGANKLDTNPSETNTNYFGIAGKSQAHGLRMGGGRAGGLNKSGIGGLGLGGDSTYTGGTSVSAGTLKLSSETKPGESNYYFSSNDEKGGKIVTRDRTNNVSADAIAGIAQPQEAQIATEEKGPSLSSDQRGKKETEELNKEQTDQDAPKPDTQQQAQKPLQLVVEPPAAPLTIQRKIIRNGDMMFEVDSFDASLMTLTKLAIEDGGFVASTDSNKLPNGKTRGTIVVRMLPDRLDIFVLKLRGLGDLKTQKISAQDVTKQYTDIESQLRAARAMEERLLDMIKKGNGAIKDLLAAEKELGTWREKIEQMEGEKRYYDNLVSLCTLNITLQERDIKASAGAIETENVNAGVETEDVEKSRADTLKVIDEVKGRVIGADLKKLDAGQFSATITAEVPAEVSGTVIDRLRQLGRVVRLDVDRKQTNTDGSAAPIAGAKIEKKPTTLSIHLYNLANVAPRHTSEGVLVVNDVESTYRMILDKIEKVSGRVVTSAIARPTADQVNATIRFETKSADADAMLNDLRNAGEMMNLNMTENPDTASATNAKRGFDLRIVGIASVAPRETTTQQLVVQRVGDTHLSLQEAAMKLGGRILLSSLNEGRRDQTQSRLDIEIPRTTLSDWQKLLDASGNSMVRNVSRSTDTQNTIDSKVRFGLTLYALDSLPPRLNTSTVIRVAGAESAAAVLNAQVQTLGGRVRDSNLSKDNSGQSVSHIVVDVSQAKSAELLAAIRQSGELVSMTNSTNADIPDGTLAQARFDVNFTEATVLVSKGDGLWSNLRDGLATSIKGLAWSVRLVVVGVCLVAPWALILWCIWKFSRKGRKTLTQR